VAEDGPGWACLQKARQGQGRARLAEHGWSRSDLIFPE